VKKSKFSETRIVSILREVVRDDGLVIAAI